MKEVTLDLAATQRLIELLRNQSEVFSFEDEPALASLCTSLGLRFEMGHPRFDRLSPFFGVDVSMAPENPWVSRIVTGDSDFGIELRRRNGEPLHVRHRDFHRILHPGSFDERGELSRILIYPARVAAAYRSVGFDLVIVRDWVLTSCLAANDQERVSYLFANAWEIRNNIAKTQAGLMLRNRLAFSGTHDIADHLLGADAAKFDGSREVCRLAESALARISHQVSMLGGGEGRLVGRAEDRAGPPQPAKPVGDPDGHLGSPIDFVDWGGLNGTSSPGGPPIARSEAAKRPDPSPQQTAGEKCGLATIPPSSPALVLSYLVGVLLDDLAQPKWYGSRAHTALARKALALLPSLASADDCGDLRLPESFHTLVQALRAGPEPIESLDAPLALLLSDVRGQSTAALGG